MRAVEEGLGDSAPSCAKVLSVAGLLVQTSLFPPREWFIPEGREVSFLRTGRREGRCDGQTVINTGPLMGSRS